MTFQEAMRDLHPKTEPSEALAARVEAMAANANRRKNTPRLPFVFAAGVAAAALAGVVFFAAPKQTVAKTMEATYANLQNARGVHYRIIFAPKSHSQVMTYEVWRSGSSWRQDVTTKGKTFSQIITNGMFWNLDRADNYANSHPTGASSIPKIETESIQKQMVEALRDARGADLGVVVQNGRQLQKIAVPAPVQRFLLTKPQPGRVIYWIDTKLMLPVLVEGQLREGKVWRNVYVAQYDTTPVMTPDIFKIPAGTETYSLKDVGLRAGRRFARPIAEKRFATRTIALRDVQVNETGDIFVLYTDGSTPTEWRQSFASVIEDDQGTVYAGTAGAVQAFMYCEDQSGNRGIVVDGQTMTGACVVPLVPTRGSWEPRIIRIEIHFVEQIGKKAYTRTAKFAIPVAKPSTSLLPSYFSDLRKLELAGNESQFKREREDGRRFYYSDKQDWQGVISTTDREIEQAIEDVNTYLDRAEAYRKLGQIGKARDAVNKASELDGLAAYADRIAEERKKLR